MKQTWDVRSANDNVGLRPRRQAWLLSRCEEPQHEPNLYNGANVYGFSGAAFELAVRRE
jgi:hypothetical protein